MDCIWPKTDHTYKEGHDLLWVYSNFTFYQCNDKLPDFLSSSSKHLILILHQTQGFITFLPSQHFFKATTLYHQSIKVFFRWLKSHEHWSCHDPRHNSLHNPWCHFLVGKILHRKETSLRVSFGLFSLKLVFIPQFSRVAGRLARPNLFSDWFPHIRAQAGVLIGRRILSPPPIGCNTCGRKVVGLTTHWYN